MAKQQVDNAHALEIAANHRRRSEGGEVLTQTEKACVRLMKLVYEMADACHDGLYGDTDSLHRAITKTGKRY